MQVCSNFELEIENCSPFHRTPNWFTGSTETRTHHETNKNNSLTHTCRAQFNIHHMTIENNKSMSCLSRSLLFTDNSVQFSVKMGWKCSMTSYEKKAKNRDINCEWSITMVPNDDEVSLSSCSKPLFHVMVNPRADDEKLIGLTSVSQVKVNSAKKIMGSPLF